MLNKAGVNCPEIEVAFITLTELPVTPETPNLDISSANRAVGAKTCNVVSGVDVPIPTLPFVIVNPLVNVVAPLTVPPVKIVLGNPK
jgi:hypothetical protein